MKKKQFFVKFQSEKHDKLCAIFTIPLFSFCKFGDGEGNDWARRGFGRKEMNGIEGDACLLQK